MAAVSAYAADCGSLAGLKIADTTGKLDTGTQPHHLGRLTVFAGVRDLPTRVKCAILPWHTLHAALHSLTTTSTEADADPLQTPVIGT